jgi:alkanesulfonate monooxygenase SsuD/methylene tetrahydromethanopterin reductase-like flavin-dependent oxidoreductase (luciferase family)
VATGRFIDRNRLHYIDFEGKQFSVKGPSITPRPPQGQPPVAALGHVDAAYRLIAGSTDIGFVTPQDRAEAATLVDTVAALRPAELAPVLVFADLVVFLADTAEQASERRARLDERAAIEYRSDAKVFVGTPADLADLLEQWHTAGLAGFRLRPATLPHDLLQITNGLAPELRRRGLLRSSYEADTLRGLLGLTRPANRFTSA